jgi:hypothetical protein
VAEPVAHMAVAVPTPGEPVDPAPELRHHAAQVQALRELGREVPVGGEHGVVLAKRVRHPDVCPFLAASRVDRPRQPALPVQRLDPLVEVPAQLELVQDVPQLVVGQPDPPVRFGLLLGYFGRHGAPSGGV